ncbi:MAG: hypothetical protein JJU28_14420 [Cyclobacteriaceae bacterium]|nr:hypothetical protein [Cyclobacteriaceae bacterium]
MLKTLIRFTFIPLFLGLLLSSCEECEDCDILFSGPFIRVDFRPVSFLQQSERALQQTDTLLLNRRNFREALLEEGLDTAGLGRVIDSLTAKRDTLRTESQALRGGRVFMRTFEAEGGRFVPFFQDTVINVFNIPLNMEADSSTFYFTFESILSQIQDTLTVRYSRNITSGFFRVNLLAQDALVSRHTFDSISVTGCRGSNCISNEVTIRSYF